MPLPPGKILGRYEIRSLLGLGGMGEVYLAQDTALRRSVAIKLLPEEFTANEERLHRFEREAYAASSLNHPNILTIHEVGQQEGHHFIATEYIEGESLRQHMGRARMELREVLDVAQQVASALAAAHQAGIVHRDIKPGNIMLRRDGYVKLLDFGLAKLAEDSIRAGREGTDRGAATTPMTEPGIVMGTPKYMSPEQARGIELDARTDIWSLGVVLYEMVSGRLPFDGPTMSDVIALILHKEPPTLLRFAPNVPPELERIVTKALNKDKEERYQVVKDLALDLKSLKQHLEFEAELERTERPEDREARRAATSENIHPSAAEYITSGIKRHRRAALLILATVVAVTVAVAYLAYSRYFVGSGNASISSIAVLPFANTSGDPNMEYLSDGLSESLINALSQLPQLKVIARSSAFKYKGKEIDPQEVATALGVQALVTGRVVQRGGSLQVSAEMVDARNKTQMWGEHYSRKATDIQAVQEEIARTISEKLRLRLTGAQEQQLAKHATTNPEAYQLYLNGIFYHRKGGFENGRKSLDYFNQAVALDPNFALAWAGVANAYIYLAVNSVLDPKEAYPKAKVAAQKALELDETLAETHSGMGAIKRNEWDWAGAEREFKRAIELNPNLADAHLGYSVYLTNMGRHTEALAEIKRAQELDPLRITLSGQEGEALYFARRYDEAIQQLQNVIKMEPDNSFAHAVLGYTYAAKEMYSQAIAEHQKSMSIDGENTSDQCYLGYALAMSGTRDEALALLNKLKTTKEYVSPAELAALYAGLGDKEQALASLEKAFAAHDLQLQFLKVAPNYDSLRSDPRFQDLMRRVGLPQ
jgi:eukaryotic-like serine/threonine-protein kinase